jgi:surface protein
MFGKASDFDQDLSSWKTSTVTGTISVFSGVSSFNKDLAGWDVSKVKKMTGMFGEASSFNQDLSSWSVSNVTGGMYGMLYEWRNFLQPNPLLLGQQDLE